MKTLLTILTVSVIAAFFMVCVELVTPGRDTIAMRWLLATLFLTGLTLYVSER